jgi:hypothetical protein
MRRWLRDCGGPVWEQPAALEHRAETWNPDFGFVDALSIIWIVLCASGWTHGDLAAGRSSSRYFEAAVAKSAFTKGA